MDIQNYHKQQIIAWLTYNPYFESRLDNSDNRVCYIYPRFLFNNGRYIPIDNKQDFPQVGRIAVRIHGQINAEEVYNRLGPIVSCRINTIPIANYSANNYYALRYNPQYGREGSEIWMDRIDGNIFYQILNINQTINDIMQNPEIEFPFGIPEICSNNVLLGCEDGRIYGPFDFTQREGLIQLKGLERTNYMVGAFNLYGAQGLSSEVLTFLDQNDQPTIDMLPTSKLPSPYEGVAQYDMIDQGHLIEAFLDNAKSHFNYSRNEFRELKAYCDQVLNGQVHLNISEERYNRLHVLLPRLFDNEELYRRLLETVIDNDEMRKHLIADIINTKSSDLVRSLPSSLLNEVRSAIQGKIAETVKHVGGTDNNATESDNNADPTSNGTVYNFLLNPNIKENIEEIANESEQLLSSLNIIYSNTAFISDPDVDMETINSKKEMNPENIKHALDVAQMLLGFVSNMHLIIDGAIQYDESKDQKRFKDYTAISARLEQVQKDIQEKCNALRGSDQLKGFVENFDASSVPADESSDSAAAAASAASAAATASAATAASAAPSATAVSAANVSSNDPNAQAVIASLQQQLAALKHECEKYKLNEQLQENIQSLTSRLETLQSSIADKEAELTSVQTKINDQGKISNEIIAKLQKNVANYQNQASTAVHLLDQAIIKTILEEADLASSSALNFATPAASAASAATPAADAAASSAAADSFKMPTTDANFNVELLTPDAEVSNANQIVERISDYLNDVGNRNLSYNEVANYLICLTQGFITTIAGEPGTGKTSLCNLLAHALGLVPDSQDTRFIEVSVERGWTSLKDLIGYYNPLTKRMEKSNAEVFDAFVRLNKEAQFGPDGGAYDPSKIAPYLILLDEANLSPIEHYWAAFFRNCDFNSNNRRSINLGGNATWLLPEHLRFLATVNFDHTTEELSSRFLDRSWVITLEPTSIQLDAEDNIPEQAPSMISFAHLQQAFNPYISDKLEEALMDKWQNIQNIFASDKCALPIRPRNLMMVYNYCLAAQQCMQRNTPNTKYAPLDYAVAQKILPTINGTGERYKLLVEELLKECNEQYMPLCAKHLKRIQRNGGADLGFYQFFAR